MGENTDTSQMPAVQKSTLAVKLRMYPALVIPNNTHPNKLYAFPFIGLLVKGILLIPVFILLIAVSIIYSVLLLITPFVILFSGKYWDTGYKFTLRYLTYTAKIALFTTGITDKYPGFSLEPNGVFDIRLEKPSSPNRLLAFPVLGYLIRVIIIFPFSIYQTVLAFGVYVAMIASWFGVWIKGSYPESLYEFIIDELRVALAYTAYTSYLSDTYPSFKISMNHKTVKIILLILGIILMLIDLSNQTNNFMHTLTNSSYYNSQ
jgi:hypothetical protein